MKNKEFDAVKTVRLIRDKNYEETKGLTREELLERYKKRGKTALDQFKKGSTDSKVSG